MTWAPTARSRKKKPTWSDTKRTRITKNMMGNFSNRVMR